jgi:hypothetical protein
LSEIIKQIIKLMVKLLLLSSPEILFNTPSSLAGAKHSQGCMNNISRQDVEVVVITNSAACS